MTGWDILNDLMKNFPPIAAVVFLLVMGIFFAIGFFRHGVNFIKYGSKQMVLDTSLEKRFDDLGARMDGLHTEIGGLRTEFKAEIGGLRTEFKAEIDGLRTEFKTDFVGLRTEFRADNDRLGIRIDGLHTELETIKVNHFGHLKNFLTELTSILLDKDIINNENKARLDNQLRGM
jgi:hypothetical protein